MWAMVDWAKAQVDEDERVAREASAGGRWRYSNGDTVGAWTLYDDDWEIASLKTYRHESYDYAERMPAVRHPRYVDADANGEHIAAWQPARVLALTKALRKALDEFSWEAREVDILAGLVEALYGDRDGYQEEWRCG